MIVLTPEAAFAYGALVLGLLVGSFLNVVVHRLPRGESIVFPPSRCPSCGTGIRPWHNVPVLSWLWLRGRCVSCSARISFRYPAVEATTGLLFFAIAVRFGPSFHAVLLAAFAAALVAAALIDFDHQIIPDEISLGGLVVGLVVLPIVMAQSGMSFGGALRLAAMGAQLGGGLLWLVGFVHARVCAAFGRRFPHWPGEDEPMPRITSLDYWTWFPGLGFGDVKLLAMIGAFLGPALVLETIFLACFIGLAFGVAGMMATRSAANPFGFGPAIAAGALIVLLSPIHFLTI